MEDRMNEDGKVEPRLSKQSIKIEMNPGLPNVGDFLEDEIIFTSEDLLIDLFYEGFQKLGLKTTMDVMSHFFTLRVDDPGNGDLSVTITASEKRG